MNPDLTVIRRHGRYSVLAHSQPARLRDGTVVDLYLVQEAGGNHLNDRFLRAVLDHELIQSHVFDVRDLAKCLDAEIRTAQDRDAGDLVVLTLRQFYPDGAGMLTRIVEESLAKVLPATHFIHGDSPQVDLFTDPGDRRFWPVDLTAPTTRRHGQTERQRRNNKEATHV